VEETAAIVLAAGKSTRMKSDSPKVLHEVCGRPMLSYVLDACRLAGVDRLFVVVGYGRDVVIRAFEGEPDLVWVEQREQKGTGHAVQCCREGLADFSGGVLVIAGDMPLVRREVLASLIEARRASGDAVSIATTFLDDPSGYGRIVRDATRTARPNNVKSAKSTRAITVSTDNGCSPRSIRFVRRPEKASTTSPTPCPSCGVAATERRPR
jgi:bifunctional UDP-N-acetylglucosamine pyrophosphorylase/glucosamine-1-phosphate N-acetyltransferase